jgi:hypothetical protein
VRRAEAIDAQHARAAPGELIRRGGAGGAPTAVDGVVNKTGIAPLSFATLDHFAISDLM